jgi:ankyrin repeat protein
VCVCVCKQARSVSSLSDLNELVFSLKIIDSTTLANLINRQDSKGHTALHYAAHIGCSSVRSTVDTN